jgi:4-hydroxy-tetrahydrodipicolinate synthase
MFTIGRHVSRLAGYAPALPTPFCENGSVEVPAFEQLCACQLKHGATALVVCGTTGEAPTLSQSEQSELIRVAASVAKGRIPVIAGASSNATARAIELTRNAEAAGADAILSVVPYYNKPTQRGLYAHFRAIAESSGLPVILYDVPARTGCGLSDETVARLAELPRITGLKDATGDLARPVRLRSLVGPDFRLLSGDDATALAFFAQGGNGCISVTSNVAPGLCRMMYLSCKKGEMARAQALAFPVAQLTAALFQETSPSPLKYALHLLGLMTARVRLPLVEVSETSRQEIAASLAFVCDGYTNFMVGEFPQHASRGLPRVAH